MLINSFNPGNFMPATQLGATNSNAGKTNFLQDTSFTPTTLSSASTVPPSTFPQVQPEFSGNAMFGSLTDSLSQLSTDLQSLLDSGGANLGQMSLNMPTLNMPTVSMPQATQPVPSISRTTDTRPKPQQIFDGLSQGASQGLKDFGKMAKQQAPLMLSFGGAMAGAGAVCAFMGGAMAATGGIMLAQNHMANNQAT